MWSLQGLQVEQYSGLRRIVASSGALCALGLHFRLAAVPFGPVRSRAPKLVEVHARLFPDSVRELKKRAAARGVSWQIELRLLVKNALAGERRDLFVIKD
jgi:hypothetical protein